MSERKTAGRKPRARIGADQARVWARELVLGNPHAKAVLLAVANYMNEAGASYPGIATIARDTDLTEDTVVNRLRWLEGIGAVALYKRWIDENGNPNYDGRGRPTSQEIRFLFDADDEDIAERAAVAKTSRPLRGAARRQADGCDVESETSEPEPGADEGAISPRPGRGLDSGQPPVSTRLAPDQPSTGQDRHIDSEAELEDYPQTPSDEGAVSRLSEFADSYPIPISDFERARTIWRGLTDEERSAAITGARGYAALCRQQPKRAVEDAHRWLRHRKWQGYVSAGRSVEATQARANIAEGSPQWVAWSVFYRCCGQSGIPAFLVSGPEGSRIANMPQAWPPLVLEPGSDPPARWETVHEGDDGPFAAWMRRLRELPDIRIGLRSIVIEGRQVHALTVPTRWPPNKSAQSAA